MKGRNIEEFLPADAVDWRSIAASPFGWDYPCAVQLLARAGNGVLIIPIPGQYSGWNPDSGQRVADHGRSPQVSDGPALPDRGPGDLQSG